MNGIFTLKQSGHVGQEIISPQGKIMAWTTDAAFGEFICRILNELQRADDPLAKIFGEEGER